MLCLSGFELYSRWNRRPILQTGGGGEWSRAPQIVQITRTLNESNRHIAVIGSLSLVVSNPE